MKFILSIIISAIFIYILQSFVTIWWLFAVITFAVAIAFRLKSGWQHFMAGLIPVALVWLYLYYTADKLNESILSNKIAALFSMPNHHVLFILVSLIMGAIGGLAAVAGSSLRKRDLQPKKGK